LLFAPCSAAEDSALPAIDEKAHDGGGLRARPRLGYGTIFKATT
jgi:hypothetical protein